VKKSKWWKALPYNKFLNSCGLWHFFLNMNYN
jgi:hypothetical protein